MKWKNVKGKISLVSLTGKENMSALSPDEAIIVETPEQPAQPEPTTKRSFGTVHPISRLTVEFADGTTEVFTTAEDGDPRVLYKESPNDNQAKKRQDHISWREHKIWWQSGHHPTVG